MFFKKKEKSELTDQFALYQERKSPRHGSPQYDIDTGITVTGFEGEGQLGNVSVSGCSMKSVTYIAIKPDEVYQLNIIPGKEYDMKPFSLRLKLSWTKSSENIFLAGFSLKEGEKNSSLEQYVNILRSRGIEPDYGNMRPGSYEN